MALHRGHPDALRASYHDQNKPKQEAYDEANPHRRLNNWERAELREICQSEGLEYPGSTLSDFIRVTGRKPTEI